MITNVMLTCAGRRSNMVEYFKEALGPRGKVFACDACAESPALQAADYACVVPPVHDPDYVEALIEICRNHCIHLLVPAFEPELPLLAAHHARFCAVGTLALVSSSQVVATCYDKLATTDFLQECGILTPKNYLSLNDARAALASGELAFPVIVKPRWGVGSIETECAFYEEEFEAIYKVLSRRIALHFSGESNAPKPTELVLIQQQLSGQEYGLDIVNDLEGRYVGTFAKRKLRMRVGQTDRAITVDDEALQNLGERLGRRLGHIGILDCDVFLANQDHYVLDLNPRIGGGYPFSHVAGANFPAALIAWLNREEPDPAWLRVKPNVLASKFDCFEVRAGGER